MTVGVRLVVPAHLHSALVESGGQDTAPGFQSGRDPVAEVIGAWPLDAIGLPKPPSVQDQELLRALPCAAAEAFDDQT